MLGLEHESTEAHKLPSTSEQPSSIDAQRSLLSQAAEKLLYKRMRVRYTHELYNNQSNANNIVSTP